jgi:glycine/D-amino acid oxidase-like deaminating enzyme
MQVGVIGSGFSGLSVAHALIARGYGVAIIDVGETLDESRSRVVTKLRGLPSQQWAPEDFDLLRENPTVGTRDLPSSAVGRRALNITGPRR